MRRASRFLLLFAVLLILSGQAATAYAAQSGWGSVDITLQSEQEQSMLLVSGELPSGAKLPYEAELALPAGTQLQWIGQTLGGDPKNDPELKYVKSSAQGMDVYRFTLTRARTAQVEGVLPGIVTLEGAGYSTKLKWTAWRSIPSVRVSQRIRQGSQIVQPDAGAEIKPGDPGYSYYTKTVTGVKAGQPVELSFTYTEPAVTPGAPAGTGSGGGALVVILVIAAAGLGLFGYSVQRKAARSRAAQVEAEAKATKAAANSRSDRGKSSGKRRIEPEPETPAVPRKIKPLVPTLVVVGVFLAVVSIAGAKGAAPAVRDGRMTRDFGAPSACQSASIPFTANPGVDLAAQGKQFLEAFEGMEGVGEVTLDITASKIDLAWCESSQSEASMRQVITGTGLVTLSQETAAASAATSATMDPAGKKQTASIETASGNFSPAQIALKAGVPIELTFGQAEGCLAEVVFSELGIRQNLTQGPATVKLGALDAGTYAFACGMGHQSGQIVVQ